MRGAAGFGEKENPLEDFFFFLGGVGRKTRERNKKKRKEWRIRKQTEGRKERGKEKKKRKEEKK